MAALRAQMDISLNIYYTEIGQWFEYSNIMLRPLRQCSTMSISNYWSSVFVVDSTLTSVDRMLIF